ncbi:MAG: hypothetical protein MZV64_50335 [Ignavibacteriales bacterium]|nr:hypothetical protein [Ignavibacteriales bacterium]
MPRRQAPVFTHEMTPEEELRKHEIGRDFNPKPTRQRHRSAASAEFEEMQSVLIRYPFGIPMTLIKEMAAGLQSEDHCGQCLGTANCAEPVYVSRG